MGIISKLISLVTDPLKKILQKLRDKLSREKPSKNKIRIPHSWEKKEEVTGLRSQVKKKEVVTKHPGKLKRLYHFPWLLRLKRGIAAILLLINLAFSQFVLGSQNEGQIFFLMFIANSFILADYLWKTRSKPE